MKIHWGFWIAIGLLVIIFSALNEELLVFIIIGIIFVAVGIVKLIFRKSKSDNLSDKYKKCSMCGAWNYKHANMCHFCNKPLKKPGNSKIR